MAARHYHIPVSLVLALVLALAAASPCAARGTGGFLRDWSVSGPIETVRLDIPTLPSQFTAYPGLLAGGHVWLPISAEPNGRIDLDEFFPGVTSSSALLMTYLEIPDDGTYRLRVGSDDSVRVEIDGRVVHNNPATRPWRVDQDIVPVTLSRGWHRVLVRVVNYQAAWKLSVRVADEKDLPLDLNCQATVPAELAAALALDDPMTIGERAEIADHLAAEIAQLQTDLGAAIRRLNRVPPGYVTFAEYEGARAQGIRFFTSVADFWRETGEDDWNLALLEEARREAATAARTFSEVLAQEADAILDAQANGTKIWELLGGEPLPRRDTAAAVARLADRLARTRRLAARVENERLQALRFENDIRNWRQRDLAVRVVDAEGGPVDGATVEIVQTRHDFLFGCNLFALHRWEDDPRNRLYEKRFSDLFNLAVVPAYWSAIEKRQGRADYADFDAALGWCRQQRISVMAHPILWTGTMPRWLDDLKPEPARAAVESHVRQIVERYRDSVDFWTVVQDPAATILPNPMTVTPADALKWAAGARPAGRLLVGGGLGRGMAEAAGRATAAGARLDGVTLRAAQEDHLWPIAEVSTELDAAAAAGLPVYVSELAIPGRADTEAEQAEAVRHFYTAAFAHPKVAGITWWDLSDRFAAGAAPVGLLRADLSAKPAYEVLDQLINHLWRTDAAGRSADDGRVAVRAFFGQYRITARAGQRRATITVHLGRDGPGQFTVTLPPK
jgi:endo-1,4-beta-xylanase